MAKLAFANTAGQQVLGQHPADLVGREWLSSWMPQLYALGAAGGEADVVGIACARLELLGALLSGEAGDTKSVHFVQFCDRFLAPINANYAKVHNLSGASHSASELHASFRTRALWGAPPPPHALSNAEQGVIAFVVGGDEGVRANHLRVLQSTLYLHVPTFLAELVQGIAAFAQYLRDDKDAQGGLKPVERFRRGLWWRLRPSGLSTKVWAAEAAARGIPAA